SIRANESHRDTIYSMYTFFAEPRDAVRLAERLDRFAPIMAELWEEEPACVYHFITGLPQGTLPEAADVYLRWVESVFTDALRELEMVRSDSLASAATVLFCQRDEVLRLLNADKAFRDRFLTVYWPRVVSLVEKQQLSVNDPEERELMWAMLLSEPRLWQFLHETACENRLEHALGWLQSYGPVAIDLWLTPELKERELRERLIDALTHADEPVLCALANEELRALPSFRSLLKRPISRAQLAAALHRLGQHPGEEAKILEYWSHLSDYPLAQELLPEPSGPVTWLPGYQVYYVIQKARQGREVTYGDTFFAFLDAVSLVPVGFGGSKLLEIAGKKTVQKMAAKTASSRLKELLLKELPETVGWQRVGTAFRSHLAREAFRAAKTDVSSWIRFSFELLKRAGGDRRLFRTLTGLEPRVFMRRDRCVFFNWGALVDPRSPYARVLQEGAINAGCDVALGSPQAITAIRRASEATRKAWHQFLSGCWLAVGTGQVKESGRDVDNE
ncbi:MAG: hypothetical protein NZ899_15140, partial [Thermoguttaceae bacterium]|nr:hypothetical protein [Thermoguttaceae bacterium]